MLLTVLVVAQAAAEWVEISQQHYRKPIRTHSSFNPFTTPDKFEVEETTKSWTYNNRSVTEYNWNKPPKSQTNASPKIHPNAGNGNRVQFPSSSVLPTASISDEDGYSDSGEDEFQLRTQEPTKPSLELRENTKQKAIITRVSNLGNVKRVQLGNTPVKSPFLNSDDKDKIAKTRYEELPLGNEQTEAGLLEHKRKAVSKPNIRRIYVHEIKNRHSTESTDTFNIEDDALVTEEVIRKRPKPELKNRPNIKSVPTTKPTFITETEEFVQSEKYSDDYYKVTQRTTPHVTEKKRIFFTTAPAEDDDDVTERIKMKPKQTNKPKDEVKHRPANNIPKAVLEDEHVKLQKNNKPNIEQENKPEQEVNAGINNISDKEKKINSHENKPDNKAANMENLLKLMKVVADTISQNTRRSFGGKMRYLHDLKDTILANIAERIDATWPDDRDAGGTHRRSRAAHTARGHHVHFPSSESALMTISFLTFAVFLIKLVLQVIHTYKNKAMMVAPVMVASAGRAALHRGRH